MVLLNQLGSMKKIATSALCVATLVGLYACDNNINKVFDGPSQVEFQPAVLNAVSVGRTYPLISVATSVTAGNTISAQLNLVGPQRGTEFSVRVLTDMGLNATTASTASYTLANGGTVVFAPNSSTAVLAITVAKASAAAAPFGNLVLALDSTSADFKASPNYKRVGYSFRQ